MICHSLQVNDVSQVSSASGAAVPRALQGVWSSLECVVGFQWQMAFWDDVTSTNSWAVGGSLALL